MESNDDFLKKRIMHEFSIAYEHEQCIKLCQHFDQYFKEQQFDEWQDIYDDINNGYDNCCCKIILFEQLNINNIQQKQNEYQRLKQCLYQPHTTVNTTSFVETQGSTVTGFTNNDKNQPKPNSIEYLTVQISSYFAKMFDDKIGNKVGDIFYNTITDQEFEDIDTIKTDFKEDDSIIMSYLMDEINEFDSLTDDQKKLIEEKIPEIVLLENSSKHDKNQNNDKKQEEKAQVEKEPKIEEIKRHILKEFSAKYNENIAINILNEFNSVRTDEQFDIANILEDVEDDDSILLDSMNTIKKISSHKNEDLEEKTLDQNKTMLREIIITVLKQKAIFFIKQFDLNITEKDIACITQAAEFLTKNCEGIYHHLMGITNQLTAEDLSNDNRIHEFKDNSSSTTRTQSTPIESKALVIVKGIDFKNKKPISFWISNLYSKVRSEMYRNGELASAVRGKDIVKGYTPAEFWRTNNYGKFVKKQWPRTYNYIEAAIKDFNKRLLPPMNFNHTMFPIICDHLPDFAEYAVLFEEIAYTIKHDIITGKNKYPPDAIKRDVITGKNKYPPPPVQIDYWIIPQMVRTQGGKDAPPKNPFDVEELQTRSKKTIEYKDEFDYLNLNIGAIDDILTDPKLGYIKNKDLFVMPPTDFNKVKRGMMKMIQKYRSWKQHRNRYIFIIDRRHNENIQNKDVTVTPNFKQPKHSPDTIYMIAPKEYRRINDEPRCICGAKLFKKQKHVTTKCDYCSGDKAYMFEHYDESTTAQMWTCSRLSPMHKNGYTVCINECNKDLFCVCGEQLYCVQKSQVQNKINIQCKWCGQNEYKSDVIRICPKGNIAEHADGYVLCSVECERSRPDTYCKLSKQVETIPESCLSLSKGYMLSNHQNNSKEPITMDDALNGYMFGLSYQILNEDNISVYWYHNAGGTVFELTDIKQGWPVWFDKIDGKRQELNKTIVNEIDRMRKQDDRIRNIDFEAFERQCNLLT